MSFWSRLLGPKRNDAAARELVVRALLELQIEITQIISPSASRLSLREPELLASVAMGAIIATTPGNTPDQKKSDTADLMDALARAIGPEDILDQDEEAQSKFETVFLDRWQLYLSHVSLMIVDPERYSALDEPLIVLLCRKMNFELSLVERISMDMKLQHRITETADVVWPALGY